MRITLFIFLLSIAFCGTSQSYTYYPTGDTTDVQTQTQMGICLMGGATEHDDAMIWFLERAGGGNILVIRASGSDGYNDYLYSELDVTVQSVETIVFNSIAAATSPFVLDRIAKADAIWIAGGDQWNYVNYWRDSPVGALLNSHVLVKNAPIGGTSAGMAIAGGVYFSAQNGTITSQTAMSNPTHPNITLGYNDFLDMPFLDEVVTDTHYDDPDRRGRHVTFLARMLTDEGLSAKGIACDEYTAVCIDANGHAQCFGEYPDYDEDIYFLQANCEGPIDPEVLDAGSALTWNRNMAAVKVYRVKGTLDGANSFELSDWLTGSGGEWEHWWVENGTLMTSDGSAPDCFVGLEENLRNELNPFYDSSTGLLQLSGQVDGLIQIYDLQGRLLFQEQAHSAMMIDVSISGLSILRYSRTDGRSISTKLPF